MSHQRTAFFVSDRTGVTAESFGESLLNQFTEVKFKHCTIPFVDTLERAQSVLQKAQEAAQRDNGRAFIFSSIVSPQIRAVFNSDPQIIHVDYFDAFIPIIEQELGVQANMIAGLTHGISNEESYDARMDAVNFALNNDDGISEKNFAEADVILVGVSRSGKTPTCLYLALQYGVRAANYPLTPDDLDSPSLPNMIKLYKGKLFGLTIDPARLNHIRNERRPDSKYASLENCRFEVNEAESMFRQHGIPFMSTTHKSVEELAASILQSTKIKRRC
ncbi:posphoenolpyruvate synthetase regulatory kinase/phosphorylase PpsR [Neisseria sp. Ec49-e6-T10]|uniref:posphoenolpyruvate synthetase regulatory kinase/phosphorylase PpsR n=1 Tax=Neisseria sp. Ec49-e6-T10 TaxID=3140744 RepID=UPI003EB775DA